MGRTPLDEHSQPLAVRLAMAAPAYVYVDCSREVSAAQNRSARLRQDGTVSTQWSAHEQATEAKLIDAVHVMRALAERAAHALDQELGTSQHSVSSGVVAAAPIRIVSHRSPSTSSTRDERPCWATCRAQTRASSIRAGPSSSSILGQ